MESTLTCRSHHRPHHDHTEHQRMLVTAQSGLRHSHGLVHCRLLRLCGLGPGRVRRCQLLHHAGDQQDETSTLQGFCAGVHRWAEWWWRRVGKHYSPILMLCYTLMMNSASLCVQWSLARCSYETSYEISEQWKEEIPFWCRKKSS